ncbi:hypothetical protein [Cysteiniphilum halobium]|uniref:hypothetical protein n=1 Tax=Cysteiniphilum halobium TaxID=2219059 RepID=UPI003F86D17B
MKLAKIVLAMAALSTTIHAVNATTKEPAKTLQAIGIQYADGSLTAVKYPVYVFAKIGSNPITQLPFGYRTEVKPGDNNNEYVYSHGQAVSLFFYAQDKNTSYFHECEISINKNGQQVTNPNGVANCNGSIVWGSMNNSGYITLRMGASPFVNSPTASLPANTQHYNQVVNRYAEFKNDTKYQEICINSDPDSFGAGNLVALMNQYCTSAIPNHGFFLVSKSDATPVQIKIPNDTMQRSIAYEVVGYKDNNGWQVASYNPKATEHLLYGTKMEYTIYPDAQTNGQGLPSAPQPSDVDVSLVDGFNFGVKMFAFNGINGAVCGNHYNSDYYAKTTPVSAFPSSTTKYLKGIFPQQNKVGIGAYSACSLAHSLYDTKANQGNAKAQAHINLSCCQNMFATKGACDNPQNDHNLNPAYSVDYYGVSPAKSPYVKWVHENSINPYAYAYDDDKGNFNCDPKASYLFDIVSSNI